MATPAPSHAGWYRDPDDPKRHRYWDGRRWTRRSPSGDSASGRSTATEDPNRIPTQFRPPSEGSSG